MGGEVMAGEQGIEDGFSDQVLGNMLIASSPLMESLRLSRNPFRNRSNCSRTAESVLRSPRMVLIRAIWDRAMSATSVAHWSQ